MYKRWKTYASLGLFLFLIVGCEGANESQTRVLETPLLSLPSPATRTTTATGIPTPVSPTRTPAPHSFDDSDKWQATLEGKEGVDGAIADLAERLGVDPALIEVLQVTSDEFPGGSGLGCGKPKGGKAPDVFVTVQVIRLRVDEVVYEYHARKKELVFCGP